MPENDFKVDEAVVYVTPDGVAVEGSRVLEGSYEHDKTEPGDGSAAFIRKYKEWIAMSESQKRLIYGRFRGHWKWDLAVDWFQMSNDDFFNLYGFNFVPKGRLFVDAKNFVQYVS
ncbi:hypothetical protein JOC94_004197 [Bacillus thermophilus]|uniref:Uncharacterized protein n=1 Tax=Siminovitchia thermophila TaxID=1245522 RepID=A0ABS2RBY5_9BACI|nr:hypothetical protein [Siminovitchia thermophila]MBM7717172.1 hypothetical protein [Siminovitchia thermophila]